MHSSTNPWTKPNHTRRSSSPQAMTYDLRRDTFSALDHGLSICSTRLWEIFHDGISDVVHPSTQVLRSTGTKDCLQVNDKLDRRNAMPRDKAYMTSPYFHPFAHWSQCDQATIISFHGPLCPALFRTNLNGQDLSLAPRPPLMTRATSYHPSLPHSSRVHTPLHAQYCMRYQSN